MQPKRASGKTPAVLTIGDLLLAELRDVATYRPSTRRAPVVQANASRSKRAEARVAWLSKRHQRLVADERTRRERREAATKDLLQQVSTECLPLDAYASVGLRFVPRVVNVVTLVDTSPVRGSGTTLPLDLCSIAAKLPSAIHSPGRFSALQIGFADPRARILIFHTGRMVGTGTSGFAQARLALAMATRQLARYADVHLRLSNLRVINTVMAANLDAPFACERFAALHPDTAHFDRTHFVGLSWRPVEAGLSVEIYETGKMNIPGSTHRREGLRAFAALLPKLLECTKSSGHM